MINSRRTSAVPGYGGDSAGGSGDGGSGGGGVSSSARTQRAATTGASVLNGPGAGSNTATGSVGLATSATGEAVRLIDEAVANETRRLVVVFLNLGLADAAVSL